MRIAIIAPTEIPARRANTIQVMKMAQAFTVQGHETSVSTPVSVATAEADKFQGSEKPLPFTQLLDWQKLAHHYGLQREFPIVGIRAHPWLRRYDYAWKAVRWARSWNAEVVYTRLPQAATISADMGIATIFEVHDMPKGVFGTWLFSRFVRQMKGKRRLVVITRALARDLADKFGIPEAPPFTIVAPDGVDLERYRGLPDVNQARAVLSRQYQHLLLDKTGFIAGYTGHLYAGRGIELLLELAARLPEIVFLVAGGEPEEVARIKAQAESRHLNNLILTGFIPNAELPLFQAACDVLLMPYQQRVAASSGGDISRYLSPMKLFEYMACGRAILSGDLPVFHEVLNPNNAVLLPIDSLSAWEEALRSLIDNRELRTRLGEQARQDVMRYTWNSRAQTILENFDDHK